MDGPIKKGHSPDILFLFQIDLSLLVCPDGPIKGPAPYYDKTDGH
jgi:hypothetical protein